MKKYTSIILFIAYSILSTEVAAQSAAASFSFDSSKLSVLFNTDAKYMMDYHEYYQPDRPNRRGEQLRIVWVWDPITGKTARYYYDNKQWKKSEATLPNNPLGNKLDPDDRYMMEYHEYYQPDRPNRRGEQLRIVWVWSTKTGKTARYYYDNKQWKKSEVALPNNPLK
ncbi:MAG: hypothetical protein AAFO07_06180 [Bacteroidota bacterium]